MKKDEIRAKLQADIDDLRVKAKFYNSLRLFEAEDYVNKAASNIELALTIMPSDGDQKIF